MVEPEAREQGENRGNDGSKTSGSAILGVLGPQLRILFGVVVGFVLVLIIILKTGLLDTITAWVNRSGLSAAAFYSSFWAALAGVVVIALAITLSPDTDEMRFVLLLALVGASLGWLIGMYISPQDTPEQQAFAGFKTAVVGVLSGYLLSKFQNIFDKLLAKDAVLTKRFLQRLLFLTIPAFLVTGAVYSVREYKNLTVQIVSDQEVEKGIDLQLSQGKPMDLTSNQTARFLAEARFPIDSSVTWSIVMAPGAASVADSAPGAKGVNYASIGQDGTYKVPDAECTPCFYLIAQSNKDPTKLARRAVNITRQQQGVQTTKPKPPQHDQ